LPLWVSSKAGAFMRFFFERQLTIHVLAFAGGRPAKFVEKEGQKGGQSGGKSSQGDEMQFSCWFRQIEPCLRRGKETMRGDLPALLGLRGERQAMSSKLGLISPAKWLSNDARLARRRRRRLRRLLPVGRHLSSRTAPGIPSSLAGAETHLIHPSASTKGHNGRACSVCHP